MPSIAILGCSGYTGQETLDRVLAHPELEPVALGSDTLAGEPAGALDPRLNGELPRFVPNEDALASGADIVFCCLGHEQAAALEPPDAELVVDLSGAHRLTDAAAYERWYGFVHPNPGAWSYGIPELFPPEPPLVANPGCYATAALLALVPIADAIDPAGTVVDAKSGVSGAGRALKASSHAGFVLEEGELGGVRMLHARELGCDTLVEHAHGGRVGVGLDEQLAQVGVAARLDVAGHEQPAAHRQQVRDEADRESERLRDLRGVLVGADAVGREVLEHEAGVRARREPAARARDARLRVHDDARRLERSRERRQGEERGRGVAAGVRDQPPRGREELGHGVAPVGQRLRRGVLEAVPGGIEPGIGEPVRAGEVDDDRSGRRVEASGLLVP